MRSLAGLEALVLSGSQVLGFKVSGACGLRAFASGLGLRSFQKRRHLP